MDFNISFNQTSLAPITATPSSILINIKPLALLVIGIVIYAIFIFKFYKYLAKRDILMKGWNNKYNWETGSTTHKLLKILLFALEYIVLVPIIIFFWFLVMAAMLLFMSNNSSAQIMLVSMAIIAAIRITAYYDELLSVDLAKMMPFTLLGIFIIDMTFFSFETTISNSINMLTLYDKLVFYLLFVVAVEFIMRIIQLIRNSLRKNKGVNESRKKKEERSTSKIKEVKKNKNQEDKNLIEIDS